MTALELRLEKAEFLLRQSQLPNPPHGYRTVAPTVEQLGAHYNASPDSVALPTEVLNPAMPQVAPLVYSSGEQTSVPEDATLTRSTERFPPEQGRVSASLLLQDEYTPPNVHTSIENADDLENPYDVSGDFEWDESSARSPTVAPLERAGSEQSDEAELIGDGMATLAVDESQGAYFGVASGAALLRAIDPVAAQHSPRPVRA